MYKEKFIKLMEENDIEAFYIACNFAQSHKSQVFNQVLRLGDEFHLTNTINKTTEIITREYIEDPMFVVIETNNTDGWICDCGKKNPFSNANCSECNTHYEERNPYEA